MQAGAPPTPTRKDRAIAKVVSFVARSVYRQIDVHAPSSLPDGAPLLTVSNHFGGVSDVIVLLDVLPRRPGIVARDVIWRVPLVGRFMDWIGGIPVHKPEDRGARSSNDQMFASCYRALGDGGHILIFPEGVTRNEPSIAPLRTGAARIALGARAAGVSGVEIVPVGIHYEDRAALRSRVFVDVGPAIDLDRLVAASGDLAARDVTADDVEAVRALTGDIEVSLRRAAPDYEDWTEAHLLIDGAEIALRSQVDGSGGHVPLELRDRFANTLADRPADRRAAICDAVVRYNAGLDAVGFSDAELHATLGTGRFTLSFLWQVLVGLFLLPFAVVGAAVNVVPFLIVKAVGAARVAPSVHATVKPIAAVVSFGLAWALVIGAAVRGFGWEAGLVAFVLLPVYLASVIVLADRASLLWRLVRTWRAGGAVTGLEDRLAADRAAVVDAVLAA